MKIKTILAASFMLATSMAHAGSFDDLIEVWSQLATNQPVSNLTLRYERNEFSGGEGGNGTMPVDCDSSVETVSVLAFARTNTVQSDSPYKNLGPAEALELFPSMCDEGGTQLHGCSSTYKLIGEAKPWFDEEYTRSCNGLDVEGLKFENIVIPNIGDASNPTSEPIFVAVTKNNDGDIIRVAYTTFGQIEHIGNTTDAGVFDYGSGVVEDEDGPVTEEDLKGIIVTRSDYNIPFATSIRLKIENRKASRRIRDIVWEVSSDDGDTWERALNRNGTPVTRFRIAKREVEREHLIYRASYTLDGKHYNTEEGHVYALVEPKPRMEGPNVTYTTHPITLEGTIYNDVEGLMGWEVYSSKSRKTPLFTQSGETLTLSGLDAGGYIVRLRTKEEPEFFEGHPAFGMTQQVVQVVPHREIVQPLIRGLRNVKAGKEYGYNAMLPGPFANAKARTDLTVSGEWTLPDGSKQEGTFAGYTPPQPGEYTLEFSGVVNEIPGVQVQGSVKLRATEYVWPEWKIEPTITGEKSPVRVMALVKMVEPAVGRPGIGDEVPQYTWTLPEGAMVISQKGASLLVNLTKPGTSTISVRVFDSLGHETILSTEPITIVDSAPDFQFDALATYAGNDDIVPTKGNFRLNVSKVPANDKFETFRILDGDTVLAESRQKTIVLPFEEAGNKTFTLEASTKYGVVKQRNITLNLRPAPTPSCNLVISKETVRSWTLDSGCAVSEGKLATIDWQIGDVTSTGNKKTGEIRKVDYPNGVTITVTATTNKGKSATSTITLGSQGPMVP